MNQIGEQTQIQEEMFLANLEAERYVIGSIMMEPELYHDCFLQSKHFYDQRHINIFETFRSLTDRQMPIDPVAIVERIGQDRVVKIGGLSYLMEMAMGVPSTANFNFYQGLVREYAQKRQIVGIGRDIMEDAMTADDPASARQSALDALSLMDDDEDEDDGHISGVLVKVYDQLEQDNGEITGAASGYRDLDKMTGGFQRQDLIIVGARPSVGKTAFATNIAQNYAVKSDGPVGIFSLEMPDTGLGKRLLSSEGNIDAVAMRNPMGPNGFQNEDWRKLTMSMGSLSNSPLHIFDKSGADINFIRKKCRMMVRKYPGQHVVIVIDYLQLIIGNPKHGGNRTAEISEISRMLKGIARDLDITVIALSQLSRGVEQRQDKRPMMSDLRESGQIEQDADVIAFLYREDYYDKETEDQNIIEIIIAKQRNGPVGTVKLAFIKEYSKFVTIDWSNHE